jgi:tRNA threonylcarbamoyl adenosine modification protein (Sua5/YciO/YrdC/YwlC family)
MTMARHFTSLSDPELVALINDGSIGVIPTDTVYGLVGKVGSQKAIERMYAVKSRARQPGTTIAASLDQLENLGFPAAQLERAKQYWPNALSVEMSAIRIPYYLSTGQPVMAARIPDSLTLTDLLHTTGPLMTTSANAPKQPTSTSIQMAVDYFGDEVDFYVDGGDLSGRPPSTIVGFDSDGKIILYRQGAVKIEG